MSDEQMPDEHAATHDHAETTAPTEGAPVIVIVAAAMKRFHPAQLGLDAGQPVNLVFRSEDTLHDRTIDEADFHMAAEPEETAAGGLEALDPGTYVAYCSVPGHRDAGMEPHVVVS